MQIYHGINKSDLELLPVKPYVRAVIFDPIERKCLFSYFIIDGVLQWGLIGGSLDDGESSLDAVNREIGEETGYTSFSRLVKLPDIIYSPHDPRFDSPHIKKSIGYLVVVDLDRKERIQLSDREKSLGFGSKWDDPKSVKFEGYYSGYQFFLDRAIDLFNP